MSTVQEFHAGRLVTQLSNGTQPGDATPSGYTIWDANGTPTTRALTTAETAQLAALDIDNTQSTNQAALQSKAQAALTANATYLAIGSPSNAQVSAQVTALTKEATAVIRLLLGQLDSTTGT